MLIDIYILIDIYADRYTDCQAGLRQPVAKDRYIIHKLAIQAADNLTLQTIIHY